MEENPNYKNRSVAIVIRDGKILMERLCYKDANNAREVVWKSLNEISEKDRAFLWSYGLIQVQGFYETIVSWGDEISYPGQA